MKVAFLVVFDVPAGIHDPSREQRERVRGILADVVRKSTEAGTEVVVLNHQLTAAELAELP